MDSPWHPPPAHTPPETGRCGWMVLQQQVFFEKQPDFTCLSNLHTEEKLRHPVQTIFLMGACIQVAESVTRLTVPGPPVGRVRLACCHPWSRFGWAQVWGYPSAYSGSGRGTSGSEHSSSGAASRRSGYRLDLCGPSPVLPGATRPGAPAFIDDQATGIDHRRGIGKTYRRQSQDTFCDRLCAQALSPGLRLAGAACGL